MIDFKIFTEGQSDVVFIRDYIDAIFGINLPDAKFDKLGSSFGYKIGGKIYPNIELSLSNNENIILILDADTNFKEKKIKVLNDFKKFDIAINLFLFPNNDLCGNLEDLLTAIATERKLIDCFLSYEQCVKDYNLPLEKSRIYAYLDALLPHQYKSTNNDLRQPLKRNYRNPAHWNLQHEFLQPFRDFLSPFLVE